MNKSLLTVLLCSSGISFAADTVSPPPPSNNIIPQIAAGVGGAVVGAGMAFANVAFKVGSGDTIDWSHPSKTKIHFANV
ncbi:MAG: hypothetical protein LBJ92_04150 [Holosporales bacterium]|nr:hypothetical protein [Holosporales bacterium]